MKQIRPALLLAFLTLLAFLGCQGSDNEPSNPTSSQKRVVSLLPSATELVFAVGKGQTLVGVTINDDFPPEVKKLPKVGGMTVDFEKLLSLKPDLVILDSNFNKDKDRLVQLGVPYLELNCERLSDVGPAMVTLGEALGDREAGLAASKDFEKKLEAIEPVEAGPEVFIEVWGDPLQTSGSETLLNDLLVKLGLTNTYADQPKGFQVDPEDVVSRQPPVVLLLTPDGGSKAEQLLQKGNIATKVIQIDPNILVRPGPRLIDGLQELKRAIDASN